MSKESISSRGANSSVGDASETESQNKQAGSQDGEANAQRDSVSYDTHRKLLSEKKRLEERLSALESDAKAREERELTEKQEYKKLAEIRAKEAEEWRAKHSELEGNLSQSVKLRAFLDAVDGEIEKPYWNLIDLESIAIDPETRLPDESSVQRAAREFESKYSRVISRPTKDTLPADAARGSTKGSADLKSMTYEQKLQVLKTARK